LKLLVTVPWDKAQLNSISAVVPQVAFSTALTTEQAVAAVVDAEVVFGDFSREVFLVAKKLRWIQ
jgi:hypothetical protein